MLLILLWTVNVVIFLCFFNANSILLVVFLTYGEKLFARDFTFLCLEFCGSECRYIMLSEYPFWRSFDFRVWLSYFWLWVCPIFCDLVTSAVMENFCWCDLAIRLRFNGVSIYRWCRQTSCVFSVRQFRPGKIIILIHFDYYSELEKWMSAVETVQIYYFHSIQVSKSRTYHLGISERWWVSSVRIQVSGTEKMARIDNKDESIVATSVCLYRCSLRMKLVFFTQYLIVSTT